MPLFALYFFGSVGVLAHFIKFIHREWAGLFFFACLLIPSVILIYLIDSISGDTKLIQKNWLHFSRQHSAKTLSLNTLHKEIGYGGLIHQFKNQLLRGDVVKAAKIRAEIEEAKRALMAYAQLGVNNEEKAALHSLRAMIDAYSSKFSEINTLRAQGHRLRKSTKEYGSTMAPPSMRSPFSSAKRVLFMRPNRARYPLPWQKPPGLFVPFFGLWLA